MADKPTFHPALDLVEAFRRYRRDQVQLELLEANTVELERLRTGLRAIARMLRVRRIYAFRRSADCCVAEIENVQLDVRDLLGEEEKS